MSASIPIVTTLVPPSLSDDAVSLSRCMFEGAVVVGERLITSLNSMIALSAAQWERIYPCVWPPLAWTSVLLLTAVPSVLSRYQKYPKSGLLIASVNVGLNVFKWLHLGPFKRPVGAHFEPFWGQKAVALANDMKFGSLFCLLYANIDAYSNAPLVVDVRQEIATARRETGLTRLSLHTNSQRSFQAADDLFEEEEKEEEEEEEEELTLISDTFDAIMNLSTHKQQHFSNLGYMMARWEMSGSFARRLKVVDYFSKYIEQEIAANESSSNRAREATEEEEAEGEAQNHTFSPITKVPAPSITAPVFVVGLPRTGTTYLHRLLSLDPRSRAPLLWELANPVPNVPLPSFDTATTAAATAVVVPPMLPLSRHAIMEKDREERAEQVRDYLKLRDAFGDSTMANIHESDADLPEECIMVLADHLPVLFQHFYTVYTNIGYFFAQSATCDRVVAAYAHYKRVLQILSLQLGGAEMTNPRRWVLKCPIHLFFIKPLVKTFPDAQFIWTHRTPAKAVPSLCSLIKAVHLMYFEEEGRNDAQLGRAVADMTAVLLRDAQRDFASTGSAVAHVSYEELIRRPISVVKSVYAHLGWEYTVEFENKMAEYVAQNDVQREQLRSKAHTVVHAYSPTEFELTEEELTTGPFTDYCDAYCKVGTLPPVVSSSSSAPPPLGHGCGGGGGRGSSNKCNSSLSNNKKCAPCCSYLI